MTSSPRLLWFEAPDNLRSARYGEALGRRLSVCIDATTPLNIVSSVGAGEARILLNGTVPNQQYDGLIIRSCLPYVAEALTLARHFHMSRKVVIDESMGDRPFIISKMHDYLELAGCGIPVPATVQLNELGQASPFVDAHRPPYIVKSIYGDFGRHVFLVRSLDEIAEVFRKYRPGNLMIQEFIDSDELYKLHVIGYAAVPILAIHRPSADDRLLVDRRNKYVEAGCTGDYPALAKVAEESARCLGIEFCSVDIRLRDGSPVVLEANRRPGLIGFQEDTGYEVGIDLVKYAVARITEPSRPAE